MARGVAALCNLMLSCRDSLLLDVKVMVLAEEVACLCYAASPSSVGLFPTPLLESAPEKLSAASNKALVQKTPHPPGIPRKSSSAPVKAALSSVSSAGRGGTTFAEADPDSLFFFRTPAGSEAEGAQGKAPFSHASGRSGGKRRGPGKQSS